MPQEGNVFTYCFCLSWRGWGEALKGCGSGKSGGALLCGAEAENSYDT